MLINNEIFQRDAVKVVPYDDADSGTYNTINSAKAFSVALDDRTLIIGTPYTANIFERGNIHYYQRSSTSNSWTYKQSFIQDESCSVNTDSFGFDVSVYGDWLIIGAPYHDFDVNCDNNLNSSGSIYFYKKTGTTWAFHSKKVAFGNGRHVGDCFGYRVLIKDSIAFVGAYKYYDNRFGAGFSYLRGSVFTYRYNSSTDVWEDGEQILITTDMGNNNFWRFGCCLYYDGTYLFVGANDNDGSLRRQTITIWEYNSGTDSWDFQSTLYGLNNTGTKDSAASLTDQNHPYFISLSDGWLMFGSPEAYYDENGGTGYLYAGAVYLFSGSGTSWTFFQKICSPVRSNYSQRFGTSGIFANSNSIIVGQNQTTDGGPGKVYLFNYADGSWSYTESLDVLNSESHNADHFGYVIKKDRYQNFVIGAYGERYNGAGEYDVTKELGAGFIISYAQDEPPEYINPENNTLGLLKGITGQVSREVNLLTGEVSSGGLDLVFIDSDEFFKLNQGE